MLNRTDIAASWRDWWSFSVDPRGPGWLQWLWTAAFCFALAAGITLVVLAMRGPIGIASLWHFFLNNLIVSLTIGLLIQALTAVASSLIGLDRLRRLNRAHVTLYWCALGLAGVVIGWPLGLTLAGLDVMALARDNPDGLRGAIVLGALITFAVFLWIAGETARAEAEKRATEAQLKLLQAQIEPHFLFNTLANVLTLIERDAPRATQMLEAFIDYLRSSLVQMRHGDSTVAAELQLAQSYLMLLQTRMDDRLRFSIEADAPARDAALPPLLLQPLVENAIQHGLEPKVEGGTVRIAARVLGERLVLSVDDDGLGLGARPPPGRRNGAGMALENIRQRLVSHYGAGASLTLERHPAGARATLTLPFRRCRPR